MTTDRMEELARRFDRSATRLGPMALWPAPLRTAFDLILLSPVAMAILWGADGVVLCNDASAALVGDRHPVLFGQTIPEVWPEAAGVLDAARRSALAGTPVSLQTVELLTSRNGVALPAWFDLDFSPISGESGPAGVLAIARDTTASVLAQREAAARWSQSRSVLDGMAEGFALLDAGFRLADLNAEAVRLDGRPREAIIGRTHWDAYPGSAETELGALYRHAMQTREPVLLEHRWTWPDGRDTWLDVRAYPVADGGLAVFFRDVTDRKQAEQDRDRSAELLATFLQAVPGVVYAKDRAGRMLVANRGTAELIGKPEAEFIGKTDAEFLADPVQAAAIMDTDRRIMETGRTERLEEAVSLPDGRPATWLSTKATLRDGAGAVVGLIGSSIDVTDQVHAREILARNREQLEQEVARRTEERDRVWKNSRDLLVIIGEDGVFRAVNPAWSAILGHEADDVVGRSFHDFIWPEDAAITQDALQTATSVQDLTNFENRYRHLDGTPRWISWRTSTEGDQVYAYGRDVTAEKAAFAELERTQEALRQSQKMEAVGQLTGGIAHDFNNLLTGIIGSLEIMQTRIAQGRVRELDRYIGAAQGAAGRAASLTHRLLAFSRRQTLDPRPVNVNRLVADMEDLIRRTVGPTNHVEVVGAGGLWPTLVDPHQLENALLNLCINARDAMPDGGRITIETANKWLDDRAARERDLPPGQYLSLCVSDTGTGMTPEVVARAFDPFFTTKPLGLGTGLGLSMIYGFVRQSGGQARIYTELGRGTTLCLYLPRYIGSAQDADALHVAMDKAQAQEGETVLVVDDEPTVRMLIAEVLAEAGYTILEAGDGAAALRILEMPARIDLLITDVGLPGGMNGRQVADAARVLRPGLRVLFITGFAENAAIGNGHLEPGMAVLTKPFPMEALSRKISDVMG